MTTGVGIRTSYIVGQGKLVPEDFEGRAHLDSIPIGERVDVIILRERDPRFSALVYKTFSLVGGAIKWRARNVRGWLAIKTGRADLVAWPPVGVHKVMTVPHGTGPADMNNVELEAFWEDAREVIRREILPHVHPDDAAEITWRLDERGQS